MTAAVAVTLAACSGGHSTSTQPQSQTSGKAVNGGTVNVAEAASVTPNWIFPFSPIANFSVANISDLQQLLYRPLYWFGGHNDQPTNDPGLSVARQPTYSTDGKTVTIKIKPWKWSNGEAVNAKDVVFWLNMSKAEAAQWAGTVPGAYPDNIKSYKATSADTVQLTMDKKYSSNWLLYNEFSQITPMPMAWDVTSASAAAGSGGCLTSVSKCPAVWKFLTAQSKDQSTYATSKIWGVVDGPWKLKSYNSDGHYSIVPNTAYSGSPKPKLDQVNFLPFTTDTAEFNVLKSGNQIDLGYVPPQDLPTKPAGSDLPKNNPAGSNYDLAAAYRWSINYFPINFNNPTVGPTFKQLYVRQALEQTLDQPVDVQKALRGYGLVNFGPVPAKPVNKWMSPAAKQGTPYPFDVNKAKQLLTSHGWTETNGVMTCTKPGSGSNQCGPDVKSGAKMEFNLDYASGTPSLDQEMQQYKSDASKAGIVLNVTSKPFDSVTGESVPCTASQKICKWEMGNWGGGWIYAPDYLPTGESLFATGAGSNSGSYSDAKMDKLINTTLTSSDMNAFYAFEDYTAQQLPVIFQANVYDVFATSTKVGGVNYNPLQTLVPEYWYRTK
ncbi:peptide ABC transporter substrate-binding protein [Microlunatus elymi]|uniref:Peptide ABC transporter substrate-binding protein n=1 Tax=Microlunatus elymi TaxID=2596828 RepID=A0A516Q3D5_9ACTN|nr:peptide ABC transporter substrate-binding protein [Microlunatus elymi]QDP97940.1 peptide ABC transporter substrate-binding protein [Microlunatus elymi]